MVVQVTVGNQTATFTIGGAATFAESLTADSCFTALSGSSVTVGSSVHGLCGAVQVPSGVLLTISPSADAIFQPEILVLDGGKLTRTGQGRMVFRGAVTNNGFFNASSGTSVFSAQVRAPRSDSDVLGRFLTFHGCQPR